MRLFILLSVTLVGISAVQGRCALCQGTKLKELDPSEHKYGCKVKVFAKDCGCECARALPYRVEIPEPETDIKLKTYGVDVYTLPKPVKEKKYVYNTKIVRPKEKGYEVSSYPIKVQKKKTYSKPKYIYNTKVEMPVGEKKYYKDLVSKLDRIVLPCKECGLPCKQPKSHSEEVIEPKLEESFECEGKLKTKKIVTPIDISSEESIEVIEKVKRRPGIKKTVIKHKKEAESWETSDEKFIVDKKVKFVKKLKPVKKEESSEEVEKKVVHTKKEKEVKYIRPATYEKKVEIPAKIVKDSYEDSYEVPAKYVKEDYEVGYKVPAKNVKDSYEDSYEVPAKYVKEDYEVGYKVPAKNVKDYEDSYEVDTKYVKDSHKAGYKVPAKNVKDYKDSYEVPAKYVKDSYEDSYEYPTKYFKEYHEVDYKVPAKIIQDSYEASYEKKYVSSEEGEETLESKMNKLIPKEHEIHYYKKNDAAYDVNDIYVEPVPDKKITYGLKAKKPITIKKPTHKKVESEEKHLIEDDFDLYDGDFVKPTFNPKRSVTLGKVHHCGEEVLPEGNYGKDEIEEGCHALGPKKVVKVVQEHDKKDIEVVKKVVKDDVSDEKSIEIKEKY